MKFLIFGCGEFGKKALDMLGIENCDKFIDNDELNTGHKKYGLPVISFDMIKNKNLENWIVIGASPKNEMDVAEQLLNAGISKFIFFDELVWADNLVEEKVYAQHIIRISEYYRKEKITINKELILLKDRVKSVARFFAEIAADDSHSVLTCGNLCVGGERHKQDYHTDYIQKSHITVEFYLVDAFEIFHFEPLYYILRSHGIYANFVAENPQTNTAGEWFDYETAKKILSDKNLEYSEFCNIDADIAFTTQFSRNLRKYRKAIKINMTYGCSFNKNAFWFAEGAMRGFDYKFVSGRFIKDKCLEKNILNEEQIVVVGSPKHYDVELRNINRKLLDKLSLKNDKKILCYFPTWDEDASIIRFAAAIENLKEEYYIVTKPHHCTFRLPEKKEELNILYRISDVVLDGNFDFEDVAYIGDLRLCDAKSGAALESIYINPKVPTIFLSEKEDINSYFYSEIYTAACVVLYEPELLADAVKNCLIAQTENINDYFDSEMDSNKLWKEFDKIITNDIQKKED